MTDVDIMPEEVVVHKNKIAHIVQYSLGLIKSSLNYLINSENKIAGTDLLTEEVLDSGINQNNWPCSKEMLKELIKDHERIIAQLKENMESYVEKSEKNSVSGIIEDHKTILGILKKYF